MLPNIVESMSVQHSLLGLQNRREPARELLHAQGISIMYCSAGETIPYCGAKLLPEWMSMRQPSFAASMTMEVRSVSERVGVIVVVKLELQTL